VTRENNLGRIACRRVEKFGKFLPLLLCPSAPLPSQFSLTTMKQPWERGGRREEREEEGLITFLFY